MGTPLHLDGDVRALRPPGQSGLVVVGLLGLVRDQGRHDRQMTGTNAPEVQIGYAIITFLKVLSPFAPHLAEELNARIAAQFPALAHPGLLSDAAWPAYDPAALVEDERARETDAARAHHADLHGAPPPVRVRPCATSQRA